MSNNADEVADQSYIIDIIITIKPNMMGIINTNTGFFLKNIISNNSCITLNPKLLTGEHKIFPQVPSRDVSM